MSYAPRHAKAGSASSAVPGKRQLSGMAEGDGERRGDRDGTTRRESGPVIPLIPRPRPASE